MFNSFSPSLALTGCVLQELQTAHSMCLLFKALIHLLWLPGLVPRTPCTAIRPKLRYRSLWKESCRTQNPSLQGTFITYAKKSPQFPSQVTITHKGTPTGNLLCESVSYPNLCPTCRLHHICTLFLNVDMTSDQAVVNGNGTSRYFIETSSITAHNILHYLQNVKPPWCLLTALAL